MAHHHSHDNIDWDAELERLRDSDELTAPETAQVVAALLRPSDRDVVDIGAGAGGSATAFAAALAGTGGSVTVVDSAPQLLSEATARARRAAADAVEIRAVETDAADDALADAVGRQVDLVHAAFVVHHLPDQLAALRRLAGLLRPGGRLAIVEFGLEQRVLPWDVGVGEPGLEARLAAARESRFQEMRAEITDSVRLPMGWSAALREAGLTDVRTWSYLVDRPAPVTGPARRAVLRRLDWLRDSAQDRVSADDLAALDRLLDPEGPDYVGNRDDVHFLAAHTVHVGTRPEG
ncbi:class I SAM-dependent methyltransferase [Saccharopolyspora rosea]|uniref:Class I SAM-dependent methyltransferase n=1 Tax=Saccharopolyspora rosea TaxID=524884 RepID=A0ABW3FR97_9PSEU|nr:class I SAM-dependent methyltransferase [Saccharopolyspora rosea]